MEKVEEETKFDLNKFIKEHPKTVFWTRLVLWAIFSCGLPFMFVVWRFKLFDAVSTIQIGGWGLIAIILVAVFVITVVRYVRIVLNAKYTLTGQILGGICKTVIPLVAFLAVLQSVKDNVELLMQVVGCIIACELVAIPLNPLPQWAYEAQKDVRAEERKEAADYLIDTFFSRKKEEGE